MSKRGGWGSMSERVRQVEDSGQTLPASPSGVKHCWVIDHNGRLPGLLLEWRRIGDHYDGRVVRLMHDGDAWIVVEEWLPQTMLEKA
jgi:hypothetical protein